MTGTFASRLMRSIRPLPPRGMITSTNGRARDQQAHRGAVGGGDELHRVGRQARLGQRRLHQVAQRTVRTQRLRAAAQDAGVAALDGERRGIDGHVRPALVDHAEHAERHAHAPDADAARPAAQLADLADRVGQRGHLLAALGHLLDHAVGRASGGRPSARARPAACAAATSSRLAACSAAPLLADAPREREQRRVLRRRRAPPRAPPTPRAPPARRRPCRARVRGSPCGAFSHPPPGPSRFALPDRSPRKRGRAGVSGRTSR